MQENETPKDKDQQKKYKNEYDPNRYCYLSTDCKFYCYKYWDPEIKGCREVKLEIGKDVPIDIVTVLCEMDHEEQLNDRYARELLDPKYEDAVKRCSSAEAVDVVDPADLIKDDSDPEKLLIGNEDDEDPKLKEVLQKVMEIIEKELTDPQYDLYLAVYHENKKLEEIRQDEAARTGRLVTPQAMTNRHNKILDKIAKGLGVERVKRHRTKDAK